VATPTALALPATASAQVDKVAQEQAATRDKVDAEAAAQRQTADDARRKAEAEAAQQRQIEEETRKRIEAEMAAKQQAEADAKAKADATAADRKVGEAAETVLGLSTVDRQHLQVALTSLGFDTHGNDGVLGPRSREMIGVADGAPSAGDGLLHRRRAPPPSSSTTMSRKRSRTTRRRPRNKQSEKPRRLPKQVQLLLQLPQVFLHLCRPLRQDRQLPLMESIREHSPFLEQVPHRDLL